jgi:8-oxo-dGTP pyrophosphatase MutT (NUDIX family)
MTFSSPTVNPPVEVALAILYREGKFLMQLRDNIPNILYPGCWGLFGGHLEAGENPEAGLIREVIEEIDYCVEQPLKFKCYADTTVIRHIYHAPLTVSIDQLNLQEGCDLGLVAPADLERGNCYSYKTNSIEPMGDIHRQILWDFWQAHQQLIGSY